MSNRQCIGVVGGLGPSAGVDLCRKLTDLTKADRDQDHLRVILYSMPCDIPVRPEFLLGMTKENPGEAIGNIMIRLAEADATILGMPCHTAHSPRILDTALAKLAASGHKVRFVSIIDSSVTYLQKICKHGARIGLMCTVGTLKTNVYQNALKKAGFTAVTLDEEGCKTVQNAISNPEYGIKASSHPVSEQAHSLLKKAAYGLIDKHVDAILLGCTEIPLALTEKSFSNVPVVDATSVLAQELIKAYDPEKLKSAH